MTKDINEKINKSITKGKIKSKLQQQIIAFLNKVFLIVLANINFAIYLKK